MSVSYRNRISINSLLYTYDRKTETAKNVVFFLIITALTVFALWHSQYGFPSSDEFLHLSLPYRMWQGDALIAEEWHQTQLSAFTYYPITKFILDMNNGTEGLVMCSRIACVLLEMAVATLIYFRLKRFSWLGATLSAAIFMLFTSSALSSIFYYSMGIMSMIIVTLLIATTYKRQRLDYFIAGIFMASAVLNIPHAAFMYFIYGFIVLATWFKRRSWRKEDYGTQEFLSPELFIFFTLGIVAVTLIFIAYLATNVPLDKLLRSIEPIMIDQHHDITFAFKLIVYFGCIFLYNSKIVGVAMLLLFAEMVFRRKYSDTTYFSVASVMTILLEIHYFIAHDFPHANFVNFMMFAPNCLALFCALLSNDSRVHRLFTAMYIPGIVYTFFFNLSSNQGFAALSASISVSTVASIVIIVLYSQEIFNHTYNSKIRNICLATVCCMFIFQLSAQTYVRCNCLYGVSSMEKQNIRIEDGIAKGVITSENGAAAYERYKYMIKTTEENYTYDKVLTTTIRSWMCMMYDCEISNYSSYINYVDKEFMDKQAVYFEINPEKMPDVVYVQKGNEDFSSWFLSEYNGYSKDEYDFGHILYKKRM